MYHLLRRGQGCCFIFYNAQFISPHSKYQQQMEVVPRLKNPCGFLSHSRLESMCSVCRDEADKHKAREVQVTETTGEEKLKAEGRQQCQQRGQP